MDIAVRGLNAGLMLVLPLALGAILARRLQLKWRLFAAGAGTFLFSQLLHLPFNQFLLLPGLETAGIGPAGGVGIQLQYALAVGLSAGLFEEVSRFIVLRFGLKSARSWREALMYGAGHGGVEAILVGGVVLVALLQVLAYSAPDALATLSPDQQQLAASQIEAYWAVPWYEALLGVVERIFAMCFHISAAVLVMQVFTRRRWWWLVLAVIWHTILDAAAVFAMLQWGVYASEAALAVLAAVSLWIIAALRPQNGDSLDAGAVPETDAQDSAAGMGGNGFSRTAGVPDDEALDESRYDRG